MTTPQWQPGTLYQPGSLVVPRSANIITIQQPQNASFEDVAPLNHWTVTYTGGSGSVTTSSTESFDASESAFFAGASGTGPRGSVQANLVNNFRAPCTPGKVINFSAMFWRNTNPSNLSFCNGGTFINWYDSGSALISTSLATSGPGFVAGQTPPGMIGGTNNGSWQKSQGSVIAPAGTAFASFGVSMTGNTSGATIYADACQWDLTQQGLPAGLVFVAIQALAATSAASEPAWPVTDGATVVDGGVTWEAEFASSITWQASSILHSGSSEPTWPTQVGANVADNPGSQAIAWVAYDGRITDPKCPQSKYVAISSSKVFAGDDDIVAFCATTNPLDWSSVNDAGFLPFGLQNYGYEPVAGLNIYRSNLMVFNGLGYQMWQTDEDPTNMAILDAEPVGCTYSKSIVPTNNDLCFLSVVGVRDISTAGQSANLQAGEFGKQVDPLAIQMLKTLTGIQEPRGLFFPGTGQYWLIFGSQALVLTINGSKQMNWSRYQFPYEITDWTVMDGILYLRTTDPVVGDLVLQYDADTLQDDVYCDPTPPVLTAMRSGTTGELSWTSSTPSDLFPVLGYRIYRDGTLIHTTDGVTLAYNDTGLTENTTFVYYIQAFEQTGSFAQSNNASVIVGGPTAPVLSGLITGVSNTTASLTWSAATSTGGAITGYKVYDAATDTLLHTTASLSWDDTGLTIDTIYSFYVVSTTAQSSSAHSNTVVLQAGHPLIIIDIFHIDGTWSKRGSLVSGDITVIAAAGGGASGHATQRIGSYGGLPSLAGGGGGGGFASFSLTAAHLLSTETVTVGVAGTGGASVSTSAGGNMGIAGTDGSASAFGTHAAAAGGHGGPALSSFSFGAVGSGGTAAVGDVNATSVITETGGNGGAAGGDAVPGNTTRSGAGGGTGGSTNSSGSIDPHPNGGTCTNNATPYFGGNGGDGGTASHTAATTAPFGSLYGGGGGAGGSCETINPAVGTSGAGGSGYDGIVVVVNHLT